MSYTLFSPNDFGTDFTWGISSSSFQSEGELYTGGRGPSIWDVFTLIPGKIKNNDTAEIAADFFQIFPDDLELIRKMLSALSGSHFPGQEFCPGE
jgi:beta-glucosidase/6-phospho-beta-glucosidase/beta-galactosidase